MGIRRLTSCIIEFIPVCKMKRDLKRTFIPPIIPPTNYCTDDHNPAVAQQTVKMAGLCVVWLRTFVCIIVNYYSCP